MAELKRLSVTHHAIMDFLMANPTMHMSQVAAHFNITQPWLSQIVHSDVFQTMLKEKHDIVFHHSVLPLKEKMTELAHLGLDKAIEKIGVETDLEVIRKVSEGVLDRLGFGPKTIAGAGVNLNVQGNVQVNVLRDEIEQARAMLGKAPRPEIGVTLEDGVRAPISLPAESEPPVGALREEGSVHDFEAVLESL